MERHLFKCTECGFETYLQAWKSVCPKCERGFTLVRVVEPSYEPRVRPRIISSALLLLYLLISIISPQSTMAAVGPPLLIQSILLAAALLMLTGSLPANLLGAALGLTLAAYHIISTSRMPAHIPLLVLATSILSFSLAEEFLMRRRRSKSIGRGEGDGSGEELQD